MQKISNKNFKAVVFDYGGVIEFSSVGNILEDIAQSVGVPLTDFKNVYFNHNHLSNVQNLSWKDMIMKVVSTFTTEKEVKSKVLSIVKEYESKRKINFDLLASFPLLKQQGFKVAIFSNNTSELRERLAVNGIIKLVDEVVISSEIGFQKPHKKAFDVLFVKLDVRPEEVIFIDDTPKSLEQAREIGYTPILFRNNEQFMTDLQALGISL